MAPPRGGTAPPDAKFMAVASVVGAVGFYAWFVDPPSSEKEINAPAGDCSTK